MGRKSSVAGLTAWSLAVLLMAGCGNSRVTNVTPASPTTPPSTPTNTAATLSVTAITPAAGAINVPLSSVIQMVFSSPANASTVNSTDIQVTNPKAVAGSVSFDATTNTATFTPSASLVADSTYTVKVSGVTSSSGAAMASPFTWSFATVTPAPTPTPTPAPTPTPTATVQYQAPLMNSNASAQNGQISIDTSGNMTVQLSGAAASTTYTVQFCPATESPTATVSCFSAGTVSTDASGSGSSTAVFPQPGSWAGDFKITAGKTTEFSTYLVPGMSGETYMAVLQASSTVNGTGLWGPGGTGGSTTQAPLTSGTVTYSNGTATFTVMGTSANTGFSASESETVYLDGSGTYQISTFTTNGSGDGKASTTSFGPGGDIFQIVPQSEIGFIGGFSIPK